MRASDPRPDPNDLDAALTGLQLAVPERGDPEVRHPAPVVGIDHDRIDPGSIPFAALGTGPQDAELVPLRAPHHGPRAMALVDVADCGRTAMAEDVDLLRHR